MTITRSDNRERQICGCVSRRAFLGSAGAFVAWANLPSFAHAGASDPRLVVVILRGALDGLAAVPPVGDPDYLSLRGDLAIGAQGMGSVLPLDGFFALNDAMPLFHRRYLNGEALIFHAAATPDRSRSHFEGQDILESGYEKALQSYGSGWLNRAVAALPAGENAQPVGALAATTTVPLILRGPAPTFTWTPPIFHAVRADTSQRLLDLYTHVDPELARVFRAGLSMDALAGSPEGDPGLPATNMRDLATGAARLLAAPDGPRVGVLNFDGWDTHINEGPDEGRLSKTLGGLDVALDALAAGLKDCWRETVVVVATEFGRTARENGSDGTDHGTATTAFLLGGSVKGNRVIADWPGLKAEQLYEGRDLLPTLDLRAVFKGVLRDHLGLSERVLAADVFSGSIGVRPLDDLLA